MQMQQLYLNQDQILHKLQAYHVEVCHLFKQEQPKDRQMDCMKQQTHFQMQIQQQTYLHDDSSMHHCLL
jgi:hypothetical protein